MNLNSMMKHYTDAKQDPLYPCIQENIRSASFRLNINVDDEWLPDYEDTFWYVAPLAVRENSEFFKKTT